MRLLRLTCETRPSKFAEKTFTNGSKSAKFPKVLSLKSFPLYGSRNHVICNKVYQKCPNTGNLVDGYLAHLLSCIVL